MPTNISIGDIVHIETVDKKVFDGIILKYSKQFHCFYINILRKYKDFIVEERPDISYSYVKDPKKLICVDLKDCKVVKLLSSATKSTKTLSVEMTTLEGDNEVEEDNLTFFEHFVPYRITSCILYNKDFTGGFWGHSIESSYSDAKLLSYKEAKHTSLQYNNIIKDVML